VVLLGCVRLGHRRRLSALVRLRQEAEEGSSTSATGKGFAQARAAEAKNLTRIRS
jgi:hypothetical protein